MKATLRIPTREQYAYIELEIEDNEWEKPEQIGLKIGTAISAYTEATLAYKNYKKEPEAEPFESKPVEKPVKDQRKYQCQGCFLNGSQKRVQEHALATGHLFKLAEAPSPNYAITPDDEPENLPQIINSKK